MLHIVVPPSQVACTSPCRFRTSVMTLKREVLEVAASQKVMKIPKTKFNEAFARKGEALKPKLHEWVDHPISVIRFEPDPHAFFKCKAVQIHDVEELPKLSYGKGDQVILDFGSHRVGYLSLHLGVDGVNADA